MPSSGASRMFALCTSATPLDLPRRIMCWNHIGTVFYLRRDDGINGSMADIDFTDAATRRPMGFTDNMDFIVGSIGEDRAIFASDVTEDNAHEDKTMMMMWGSFSMGCTCWKGQKL
jgi:Minichromosome loss protein, Mcl1, middle region